MYQVSLISFFPLRGAVRAGCVYINMEEECGLMKQKVLKSQITKMSIICDNKIFIDSRFVCIYVHIYRESIQGEMITVNL